MKPQELLEDLSESSKVSERLRSSTACPDLSPSSLSPLSTVPQAKFCAEYLPTLVRALRDQVPKEKRGIFFCLSALEILGSLHQQPLFKTHFLRASNEADDLLLILVELFIQFPQNVDIEVSRFSPPPKPHGTTSVSDLSFSHCCPFCDAPQDFELYEPLYNLSLMIGTLIHQSLVHGAASKVNLVLPPSISSAFLFACNAHLSALESKFPSTDEEEESMAYDIKGLLCVLPSMLGVSGVEKVVIAKRVETNATSSGTLRCALSKMEEHDWDGETSDEFGKRSNNGQRLKSCSIVSPPLLPVPTLFFLSVNPC